MLAAAQVATSSGWGMFLRKNNRGLWEPRPGAILLTLELFYRGVILTNALIPRNKGGSGILPR